MLERGRAAAFFGRDAWLPPLLTRALEFAYSVLLVVLALLGPGRISLDSFLVPRLRRSLWAALIA